MRDRLQKILSNPGCDYLEIRLEDTQTTSLRYMGDKLEDLNEGRASGGAIRALVDGCWGFTTFNDEAELEQRVAQAVAAARLAAKSAPQGSKLAPVKPVDVTLRAQPKVDPRSIPLEEKLSLFDGYNRRILAVPGITTSSVFYFDTASRIVFANSEGTFVDRERIDLACSIAAIARRGSDTRSGRVAQGSSNDFSVVRGLDAEVDRAAREALGKLDAPVIESGTYTVVCDPGLAGVFVHEAFGHLSEGDNLANDPQMQQVLTLGRRFGEDFLTIYDSGLEQGQRGHIPIDDEGVPTERTVLIEGGKLVGRLHNRETAGRMGEEATGNARAISYRHPPIPRMRNTCIAPGPHGSLNDIIKDVKLGVYAIDSAGGQTNGELFTFTAADAFMIRDGEIAERVKDVTIGGNVFSTLRNIDRVGSGFLNRDAAGGCGKGGQSPLPVSMGAPPIRIRECVIGGK